MRFPQNRFGGYDRRAVDESVEAMEARIATLSDEVSRLRSDLERQTRDRLDVASTLGLAQQAATEREHQAEERAAEVVAQAQHTAELIVAQAEQALAEAGQRASELRQRAQQEADGILSGARRTAGLVHAGLNGTQQSLATTLGALDSARQQLDLFARSIVDSVAWPDAVLAAHDSGTPRPEPAPPSVPWPDATPAVEPAWAGLGEAAQAGEDGAAPPAGGIPEDGGTPINGGTPTRDRDAAVEAAPAAPETASRPGPPKTVPTSAPGSRRPTIRLARRSYRLAAGPARSEQPPAAGEVAAAESGVRPGSQPDASASGGLPLVTVRAAPPPASAREAVSTSERPPDHAAEPSPTLVGGPARAAWPPAGSPSPRTVTAGTAGPAAGADAQAGPPPLAAIPPWDESKLEPALARPGGTPAAATDLAPRPTAQTAAGHAVRDGDVAPLMLHLQPQGGVVGPGGDAAAGGRKARWEVEGS